MTAYRLTPAALEDLHDIRSYLDPVPERYAEPIRRGLRLIFREIAAFPDRGATHSQATRTMGQEVRTRVLPPYRIFYREIGDSVQILAILHTARDIDRILSDRLQ